MAKDFSNITAQPVYNTIAKAVHTAHDVQEEQENLSRKDRKTYSAEETQKALAEGKTSGKKGMKLPRINMAFTPDVREYIETMSTVRGETMTDFVNAIVKQHMEQNTETYNKAKEFKNSL